MSAQFAAGYVVGADDAARFLSPALSAAATSSYSAPAALSFSCMRHPAGGRCSCLFHFLTTSFQSLELLFWVLLFLLMLLDIGAAFLAGYAFEKCTAAPNGQLHLPIYCVHDMIVYL